MKLQMAACDWYKSWSRCE